MNGLITSLQNPRVKEAVKLRQHRTAQAAAANHHRRGPGSAAGRAGGRRNARDFRLRGAGDVERRLSRRSTRRGPAAPRFFTSRRPFSASWRSAIARRGWWPWPRLREPYWPDWELPENPLLVVLEYLEKPGNLGSIVRTADAVGASAVLVADAAADLYNPNAIRASLGTVFTVRLAAASSQEVAAWLRRTGVRIFAARVDGAVTFWDADFRGPAAVVLGSEAHGLSSQWRADDITPISLPLLGHGDSLNVSAAAAVILYEATRQRRRP